jgi:hypothetical protein
MVMKKGISKNKVQRMRNIISGNYSAKGKVQSGYTKGVIEHVEGDVWEEKGKQWTIKHGIKQTVNKLDFARRLNKVPLGCPKCSTPLKHPAHKAMYKRWGMCLTCVTRWELDMKASGTYDEWHKQFDAENFNSYIKDAKLEYEEWLQSRNAQHYITEAGQIEDWAGGKSDDVLSEEFEQIIEQVTEQRKANQQG